MRSRLIASSEGRADEWREKRRGQPSRRHSIVTEFSSVHRWQVRDYADVACVFGLIFTVAPTCFHRLRGQIATTFHTVIHRSTVTEFVFVLAFSSERRRTC